MPLVACGFLAVAAYVYVPAMYVVDTDDTCVTADTVAVVPPRWLGWLLGL